MSITVRLYSADDLAAIKSGADPWLSTVFMNRRTFSAAEMRAYPYSTRREYCLTFADHDDRVTFYAVNDACAVRFAYAEYIISTADVLERVERTVTRTGVNLDPAAASND